MNPLRAVVVLLALGFAGVACFAVAASNVPQSDTPAVPQVSIMEIVTALYGGTRVVFVDVRERPEYLEYHIPGALNFPVRELTEDKKVYFDRASYVVPYCLRDFRGFEGAKKLRRMGVEGVYLFEGHGCNAWRAAGLPVAGIDSGLSDKEALEVAASICREWQRKGPWPSGY